MLWLVRTLGSLVLLLLLLLTGTALFKFLKATWFGPAGGGGNHVYVTSISGMITSSNEFVRDLEKQLKDRGTKAIVVRINSPGGFVAPSQEMYEAIRSADKKVPVIASMGQVAASGGYYAAIGARTVYANPGSVTGSIGVLMEFVNLEKLAQWAKVERFTISSGALKSAGSPFRKMKPEEEQYFRGLVTNIFTQFRDTVKERRKLDDAQVARVSDGRVFTGLQAKEEKLVDELGTLTDAIAAAKKAAKLPDDAPVVYAERSRGWLSWIESGAPGGEGSLASAFHAWKRWVDPSVHGWQVLLMSPIQ
jgi:protease-4